MKSKLTAAVVVDHLLEGGPKASESEDSTNPMFWPEFADWTNRQFEEYLDGLPTTFLHGGSEYALDYQNNFLVALQPADPCYRFDDEVQMNAFLDKYEEGTYGKLEGDDWGAETDTRKHIYVSQRQNDLPDYTLEQKRAHVVYENGGYLFLKLPHDPDFIQREGQLMQHCLAVAHRDYCSRMVAGQIEVYSQTDATTGKPVVNIEVALTKPSYNKAVTKPTVTQIRGMRNELPPKDAYLPSLVAFLQDYGAPKGWVLTDHGVVNFDGRTDGDAVMARWKQLQGDQPQGS